VGVPIETVEPTIQVTVNPASPIPVGTARFQLVVVDDSGNQSQPATANVLISDTTAPTAVLDAPAQAEVGQSFIISGTRSADVPPGRIVRYIWTMLQGGGGGNFTVGVPIETVEPTIQVTVNPASPIPVGTARFQLVVVDDSGNQSQPATANVLISDTTAPTAVLDVPAQVEVGRSFSLSGTRSADVPPGRIVRYIWTMLQGGGDSNFIVGVPIETAGPRIRVTVNPASPIPAGTARFQLVVVDDSGNQSLPDLRDVLIRD
jgi:hypothetical protein